jgi:hypothetical protein
MVYAIQLAVNHEGRVAWWGYYRVIIGRNLFTCAICYTTHQAADYWAFRFGMNFRSGWDYSITTLTFFFCFLLRIFSFFVYFCIFILIFFLCFLRFLFLIFFPSVSTWLSVYVHVLISLSVLPPVAICYLTSVCSLKNTSVSFKTLRNFHQ